MAARTNLKAKVRAVLVRRLRTAFGNGAKVSVQSGFHWDSIHIVVTSSRFSRMPMMERAKLVGGWLDEELKPAESARVTALLPLTPSQERRLLGTG